MLPVNSGPVFDYFRFEAFTWHKQTTDLKENRVHLSLKLLRHRTSLETFLSPIQEIHSLCNQVLFRDSRTVGNLSRSRIQFFHFFILVRLENVFRLVGCSPWVPSLVDLKIIWTKHKIILINIRITKIRKNGDWARVKIITSYWSRTRTRNRTWT